VDIDPFRSDRFLDRVAKAPLAWCEYSPKIVSWLAHVKEICGMKDTQHDRIKTGMTKKRAAR
jgi:hypothetical protein